MKIVDNTDEYFVVSTNVSFDDEILNIVKQWIPYIEILKPIELQEKLEDVLKNYLKKIKNSQFYKFYDTTCRTLLLNFLINLKQGV